MVARLKLATWGLPLRYVPPLQNVTRQQSVSGEEEQTASPLLMDTFLISILSPHLYIQSNAVEQGESCDISASIGHFCEQKATGIAVW